MLQNIMVPAQNVVEYHGFLYKILYNIMVPHERLWNIIQKCPDVFLSEVGKQTF